MLADLRHVLAASSTVAAAVQAQPDRGAGLLDLIMACIGSLQGVFAHARVVGSHVEYDSTRWHAAVRAEVRWSTCFIWSENSRLDVF